MNPTVSVVVVNFNRRALLERCLHSLEQQRFRDFEIVVVDNGSSDDSLNFLRAWSGGKDMPALRIVALGNNRGFSGGCNAGIEVATGRYIATLNNDAVADPLWLEELAGAMDSDPQIGMCASKILLDADRRRIDKVGHLIYLDGLNHGRGSGEEDRGQYETLTETLFPDGAAALYRRAMLDETGLFDEAFFAYGDDADLGLRGRLAGWHCVYAPRAIAFHSRSATAGEFSPLKAFLIERNRIFVAVKTFPLPLLAVSPLFTLVRFAFHAYGAIFSVGSSGRFAASASRFGLAAAIVRAYASAITHMPSMWRARIKVRQAIRLNDRAFVALLWKQRITLRALTLGT
ncbi:MAG TPA: glycosyltransferase family 2 protein [Terriglobia bacterium]|nr:glycosyltransferase family 2 protein [Terriglobia bacterium]